MRYWREVIILILVLANILLFNKKNKVITETKVVYVDKVVPQEVESPKSIALPQEKILYRQIDTSKVEKQEFSIPKQTKMIGLLPENYATYSKDRLKITYFDTQNMRYVQDVYSLREKYVPENILSFSAGIKYYELSYSRRLFGNFYAGVGVSLVDRKPLFNINLKVAW